MWKGNTYGTSIRLLLLADGHFAVVKKAADCVIEGQELVVEGLPEDIGLVLEAHALLTHGLVGGAAVVAHFGAQLGASGLEEVCLLRASGDYVSKKWENGMGEKGSLAESIDFMVFVSCCFLFGSLFGVLYEYEG